MSLEDLQNQMSSGRRRERRSADFAFPGEDQPATPQEPMPVAPAVQPAPALPRASIRTVTESSHAGYAAAPAAEAEPADDFLAQPEPRRRSSRAGRSSAGRSGAHGKVPPVARPTKNNTPIIIGGIAGFVVLLIIVIVATSGGVAGLNDRTPYSLPGISVYRQGTQIIVNNATTKAITIEYIIVNGTRLLNDRNLLIESQSSGQIETGVQPDFVRLQTNIGVQAGTPAEPRSSGNGKKGLFEF